MTKPVLLLDVDGVVNAFPEGYEKKKIYLEGECGHHPFYPTSMTKPFMEWAWTHFDVVWCTAWFQGANDIAAWAKLPKRPWLGHAPSSSDDWKLKEASTKYGNTSRKVLWIEDGISDTAVLWVALKTNWLYLETDAHVGLTKKIVDAAAKFAGVSTLALALEGRRRS